MFLFCLLSLTGSFCSGISLLLFTEHSLGEFCTSPWIPLSCSGKVKEKKRWEVNGTRWSRAPSSCSAHVVPFLFWSQLPIQLKLQSLCDMTTAPQTPPLGVEEVLPLLEFPFSFCVRVPPSVAVRSVPRFWVPVTQQALLPRPSLKWLSFFSNPSRTIILENDKHRFPLSVTQMCWNVPARELCFVINPRALLHGKLLLWTKLRMLTCPVWRFSCVFDRLWRH